jgi:hypothetical protein
MTNLIVAFLNFANAPNKTKKSMFPFLSLRVRLHRRKRGVETFWGTQPQNCSYKQKKVSLKSYSTVAIARTILCTMFIVRYVLCTDSS